MAWGACSRGAVVTGAKSCICRRSSPVNTFTGHTIILKPMSPAIYSTGMQSFGALHACLTLRSACLLGSSTELASSMHGPHHTFQDLTSIMALRLISPPTPAPGAGIADGQSYGPEYYSLGEWVGGAPQITNQVSPSCW